MDRNRRGSMIQCTAVCTYVRLMVVAPLGQYVLHVGQNTVADTTVERGEYSDLSSDTHQSPRVGREPSVDGRPRRATRTRTRGLFFKSTQSSKSRVSGPVRIQEENRKKSSTVTALQ